MASDSRDARIFMVQYEMLLHLKCKYNLAPLQYSGMGFQNSGADISDRMVLWQMDLFQTILF